MPHGIQTTESQNSQSVRLRQHLRPGDDLDHWSVMKKLSNCIETYTHSNLSSESKLAILYRVYPDSRLISLKV